MSIVCACMYVCMYVYTYIYIYIYIYVLEALLLLLRLLCDLGEQTRVKAGGTRRSREEARGHLYST